MNFRSWGMVQITLEARLFVSPLATLAFKLRIAGDIGLITVWARCRHGGAGLFLKLEMALFCIDAEQHFHFQLLVPNKPPAYSKAKIPVKRYKGRFLAPAYVCRSVGLSDNTCIILQLFSPICVCVSKF